MSAPSTKRGRAAARLRQLLGTDVVGDLIVDVQDPTALDLLGKLAARLNGIVADELTAEGKRS